ncbi:MAG: hypothetical protein HOM14_00655 [Gammaproteobacteria bacterium]|nr:hypothetical protein [Gammaproteobacteria bacterium]MBT3722405.1 hypothetical protein [Gammaproteobacteria bacterium]MBT4075285.1 hypothetical protein [Gammaproteobacteria bacterium]MBT4196213.1 hypothetical protein [Gammaproteobacteria bacterium]MBT4861227.1 hypothetical protein [Gammaproteobacteria bacterium]
MSELENEQKVVEPNKEIKSKKFANLWMGIFFMVSSLSLIVLMSMFVFVWQPIWTDGFKDFHTISTAIDKLDKTAQPASATIPAMLEEMTKMNQSMNEMEVIMTDMHGSMVNLEEMTPEIKSMNTSVERMTVVIATHLGRMTFLMGQIENKLPPTNMMPW